MKGLKTVFIFTLAIVLLTELVTSFSPKSHHRIDDWWMVNAVHVPDTSTESPPSMTDCLSRLAVSLAQYTPDFISAFSYIAPEWMDPVNHLIQHTAPEGELQKMSTAMTADEKMAKFYNSGLVAKAKQFVNTKVVRPVMTFLKRAAGWLGVVVVGGIGVAYAIYHLINNIVSIPIHQPSSDQICDQRQAQLTDLSESFRHEWITQWRSSESVAGSEYSEGEQITVEDFSE